MTTEIRIGDVIVKRDENGLYCLNDLWRSRGSQNKERIKYWAASSKTKDLIQSECLKGGNSPFKQSPGRYGGTYASKTLVYDYAMWISPEFKSHIISIFDGHVTGAINRSLSKAVSGIKLSMIDITEKINAASIHFDDVKECGSSWSKAGHEIRKAKKEAVKELEILKDEIQGKLDF